MFMEAALLCCQMRPAGSMVPGQRRTLRRRCPDYGSKVEKRIKDLEFAISDGRYKRDT